MLEASFTNDLGADSLDTVELIMEFEKEFDIQIPDDQAEAIATVGDAISFIEKLNKLQSVMSGRVVVTGLGALTPVGNNVSDFWKNLLDGVSEQDPLCLILHNLKLSLRVKLKTLCSRLLDRKKRVN